MTGEISYETLRVRREGWRLDVTLDRPADRNELTHGMMREIGAVVVRA
jgi:enoyl-CoA hydratase/carnithine racemase